MIELNLSLFSVTMMIIQFFSYFIVKTNYLNDENNDERVFTLIKAQKCPLHIHPL